MVSLQQQCFFYLAQLLFSLQSLLLLMMIISHGFVQSRFRKKKLKFGKSFSAFSFFYAYDSMMGMALLLPLLLRYLLKILFSSKHQKVG